jgi:hypothetical protein
MVDVSAHILEIQIRKQTIHSRLDGTPIKWSFSGAVALYQKSHGIEATVGVSGRNTKQQDDHIASKPASGTVPDGVRAGAPDACERVLISSLGNMNTSGWYVRNGLNYVHVV